MGRWHAHAIDEDALQERADAQVAELERLIAEGKAEEALEKGDWNLRTDRRAYGRTHGAGGTRRTHDVQKLWAEQHTALDMVALGFSNKQTAEVLGCTPARVSGLRNSTLGQAKLRALSELRQKGSVDVIKEVTAMLPRALAVYEEILDSEETTYTLKKSVADTLVMKIAGHEAAKKVDMRSTHFTAADLRELTERGIRNAKASGVVIEAEVVKSGAEGPGGAGDE